MMMISIHINHKTRDVQRGNEIHIATKKISTQIKTANVLYIKKNNKAENAKQSNLN